MAAASSDFPPVGLPVKLLLDFIAPHESGRDGYNAVYRGMTLEDLSALTISAVLAKQAAAVKAGAKSTAIGRYQFISTTLKSVIAEDPPIPRTALFTNNLQDELGRRLLERRGLRAYLAGQLSPTAFGNALAQEWASLPVIDGPKTGQSYYAGDGLNKALVTPKAVIRRLAWAFDAAQNPVASS